MKTIKFLSIISAVAVFFSSCSKGDTGATGPQGPAGANGSSNVTVTTITVSPGSWNVSNSYNWYYNTTVSIPTTDVCNVYVSSNGSNFTPLPLNSVYYESDELNFNYQTGYNIQLTYYNPSEVALTGTLYYNIADIPPAALNAHPTTNWQNWNEVAALPEVQAALHK
jgi:hypothetical protein